MKVCRMCWNLVDDQLEICECVTGGSPVFFKDVQEAINYFVKEYREKAEKYDQITLRGTRPVTADWIREQVKLLLDNEEEIKQLKEHIEEAENHVKDAVKLNENLKQKLETSYEAIQKVRDERNEAWTLLEQIKKIVLVKQYISYEDWVKLKEILERK